MFLHDYFNNCLCVYEYMLKDLKVGAVQVSAQINNGVFLNYEQGYLGVWTQRLRKKQPVGISLTQCHYAQVWKHANPCLQIETISGFGSEE